MMRDIIQQLNNLELLINKDNDEVIKLCNQIKRDYI